MTASNVYVPTMLLSPSGSRYSWYLADIWFTWTNYIINLGARSSQNTQVDGSGYVMNSWGYGATFISHHLILHCTPYFERDAQNCAEKCDGAPFWQVLRYLAHLSEVTHSHSQFSSPLVTMGRH